MPARIDEKKRYAVFNLLETGGDRKLTVREIAQKAGIKSDASVHSIIKRY